MCENAHPTQQFFALFQECFHLRPSLWGYAQIVARLVVARPNHIHVHLSQTRYRERNGINKSMGKE